jgi:hypothetical protein
LSYLRFGSGIMWRGVPPVVKTRCGTSVPDGCEHRSDIALLAALRQDVDSENAPSWCHGVAEQHCGAERFGRLRRNHYWCFWAPRVFDEQRPPL